MPKIILPPQVQGAQSLLDLLSNPTQYKEHLEALEKATRVMNERMGDLETHAKIEAALRKAEVDRDVAAKDRESAKDIFAEAEDSARQLLNDAKDRADKLVDQANEKLANAAKLQASLDLELKTRESALVLGQQKLSEGFKQLENDTLNLAKREDEHKTKILRLKSAMA